MNGYRGKRGVLHLWMFHRDRNKVEMLTGVKSGGIMTTGHTMRACLLVNVFYFRNY